MSTIKIDHGHCRCGAHLGYGSETDPAPEFCSEKCKQSRQGGRFAIVYRDGDGPAFSIAQKPEWAWEIARTWLDDHASEEDLECVQITEASYEKVAAGNPDAWEAAE